MARTKKKYRVISPFTYKGKDGKAPQNKWVSISPGEACPPLDSNEMERLLLGQSICEVSSLDGQNIITKKLESLNHEQIDRLFRSKDPGAILKMVQSGSFDKETLTLMIIWAEKMKMPQMIVQTIEAKLSNN